MCPSQSLDATHPETIPCLLGTLKTVNGGAPMDELLSAVLDAHGGLDNWQRVRTLRVGFSRSGPFWAARGWPDFLANETVTLDPHRQHIEFTPVLAQNRTSLLGVDPDRVAIRNGDGQWTKK